MTRNKTDRQRFYDSVSAIRGNLAVARKSMDARTGTATDVIPGLEEFEA